MHCIAEAQKTGGIAAFIDAEHAFDRGYAQKLGIDTGKFAYFSAGSRRTGAGNCREPDLFWRY